MIDVLFWSTRRLYFGFRYRTEPWIQKVCSYANDQAWLWLMLIHHLRSFWVDRFSMLPEGPKQIIEFGLSRWRQPDGVNVWRYHPFHQISPFLSSFACCLTTAERQHDVILKIIISLLRFSNDCQAKYLQYSRCKAQCLLSVSVKMQTNPWQPVNNWNFKF